MRQPGKILVFFILVFLFSGCSKQPEALNNSLIEPDLNYFDPSMIEPERTTSTEESWADFAFVPEPEVLDFSDRASGAKKVVDIGANLDLPILDTSQFSTDFSEAKIIVESGEIAESLDPDWSVSSGAYLFINDGIAMTVQGDLSSDDKWFNLYKKANSEDTDGGLHPQNIFRLVLLKKFLNYSQQVYFRIEKDNLSESSYRNGSNGLLLFNRYQSSQTLYYTGIRVDGGVTIKKKKDGIYYDLNKDSIFPGKYDRDNNPNLLPKYIWLGLKSVVTDREDGSVLIKVYLDEKRNGEWKLICEAIDDGKNYGGEVISSAGLAGIRTDFMDVSFDDYEIREIN